MSIASEIQRISSAKADLKAAINAKGGTLTTELLDDYADAVAGLPGAESYYQCVAVASGAETWTGAPLAVFSGSVMYANTSDSSSGLSYSFRTPIVGKCYNTTAVTMIEPPLVLTLAHFNDSLATVGGANYTSSGTTTYAAGKFGNAANVDSDNYITTDLTTGALQGDFTIDFWIYTGYAGDSGETYDRVAPIAADTDCYIGIDNFNGRWNIWAGDGSGWNILQADYEDEVDGIGTISVTTSTWTHIAMVHKGTKWYLFVNGQAAKQVTAAGTIGNARPPRPIRLGVWGGGGFGAACKIDELCVRNYAVWTSNFTPPNAPYAPEE